MPGSSIIATGAHAFISTTKVNLYVDAVIGTDIAIMYGIDVTVVIIP
jgi:hypothetical protein